MFWDNCEREKQGLGVGLSQQKEGGDLCEALYPLIHTMKGSGRQRAWHSISQFNQVFASLITDLPVHADLAEDMCVLWQKHCVWCGESNCDTHGATDMKPCPHTWIAFHWLGKLYATTPPLPMKGTHRSRSRNRDHTACEALLFEYWVAIENVRLVVVASYFLKPFPGGWESIDQCDFYLFQVGPS